MKIRKDFEKHFRTPRIFSDDIEEIVKVIQQELKPDYIGIKINEFELNDVSEISLVKGKTKRAKKLFINTHYPSYIYVSLGEYSSKVWTEGDDVKSKGTVVKIADILALRERPLLFGFMKMKWFFLILIYLAIAINYFFELTYPLALIMPSITLIGYLLASNIRKTSIELFKSSDWNSFFSKNKDRLIIDVIKVVIGALIGFTLGKL